GIPAGEELTYILPFWYKPDGFTMTEESAGTFRENTVKPAHDKVIRMNRLLGYNTHAGSSILRDTAMCSIGGISTLLAARKFSVRVKARDSHLGAAEITPYVTIETAHARAEMYEIGSSDLQQLIKQSGLPEQYLQPLEKYRTPYFAVMRLKGLEIDASKPKTISGQGVRYHFTHQITDGKYIYPLGTGAAWPQPIPTTEVYITAPDRLIMDVKAPVMGNMLRDDSFRYLQRINSYPQAELDLELRHLELMNYSNHEIIEVDAYTPQTTSLLIPKLVNTSAWHIAYSQSNPSEDISVTTTKRFAPWRLTFADAFRDKYFPIAICVIVYLLAWFLTARLLIRRQWQKAGSPGKLFIHSLLAFINVQLISALVIAYIFAAFNLGWPINSIELLNPQFIYDLGEFPIVLLLILGYGIMFTLTYIYIRKLPKDWRRWLPLTSWLSSLAIFAALTGVLYGFLYWCEL
ncbi:MAG: hypothetical protein WCJ56_11085, partial [bacterium]